MWDKKDLDQLYEKEKIVNLELVVKPRDVRIFMGKYNGFQRYDIIKYPFANVMEKKMRQAFWTPEEISLISDREGFKTLPHHAQEMIINNLLFQTLMDSAQNRGLDSVMSELVTSSDWEAAFKTQAFFELIHSLSYSHIIREMFSADATEVFDRIYKTEEIKHRTDREIRSYTEVREWIHGEHPEWTNEDARKRILILLTQIYFLEGLKFYISFMVTYMINSSYEDAIPGVTKIIKLINFDEDMHVSLVGGIIGILARKKEEGFMELFDTDWYRTETERIVREIVQDEVKWGEFLLSFGPVPSLTPNTFKNFMEYYADARLIKIGLPKIYNVPKTEIVEWFDNYKNINKDNTAQQEATALNYNIGNMKMDYEDHNLDEMLQNLFKSRNAD